MRPLLGGSLRLLLAAVLAASTYGCGIALMGSAAWLLSRAAEHPSPSALALMAVAVRALGLGRGLFRYAERLVGHDATLRVVADLRVAVFSALARSRVASPSGDVLSTVVTDVDAVQDLWLRCVIPFTAAVLVSSAAVTACLWWSTSVGLLLLAGLAISVVLVPGLAALVSLRETGVAALRARHQSQVLDILQGCADLTVLGAMPAALEQAARGADDLADVDRRAALRAGALTVVTGLLQTATVIGVAAVALAAVRDGTLPRVGLAVLVLVAIAAFEPITPLVDAGAQLPRTWGALRRLSVLLAAPHHEPVVDDGPIDGLELRGVGATYGRGAVLRDIDLDLRVGRCIAVTGPSGAGKSTLLRVLTGAHIPETGHALAGSVEISSLDDAQRSRHVALAEQEAHLFATTVRDNLRIGRPTATDAELLQVLTSVGLDAWFSALPQGWETRVGERGGRMSGGERTRLSLARALLSTCPVLLLDEPTEGLDVIAAEALLRSLISTNRHRALLIVTHELPCPELVDDVLTLMDGRLARQAALVR